MIFNILISCLLGFPTPPLNILGLASLNLGHDLEQLLGTEPCGQGSVARLVNGDLCPLAPNYPNHGIPNFSPAIIPVDKVIEEVLGNDNCEQGVVTRIVVKAGCFTPPPPPPFFPSPQQFPFSALANPFEFAGFSRPPPGPPGPAAVPLPGPPPAGGGAAGGAGLPPQASGGSGSSVNFNTSGGDSLFQGGGGGPFDVQTPGGNVGIQQSDGLGPPEVNVRTLFGTVKTPKFNFNSFSRN